MASQMKLLLRVAEWWLRKRGECGPVCTYLVMHGEDCPSYGHVPIEYALAVPQPRLHDHPDEPETPSVWEAITHRDLSA